MFTLSVCWMLCCVPVITFVPASAALYRTVYECLRCEQPHPLHKFWDSFRNGLRAGIALSLIFSSFTVINVIWYLFAGSFGLHGEGIIYIIISRTLMILELFGAVFLAPLYANRNMRILEYLRNAYFLTAQNLLVSVVNIVLLILSGILIVIFPPFLLIVPAFYALLHTFIIEPVLKHISSPNERNQR